LLAMNIKVSTWASSNALDMFGLMLSILRLSNTYFRVFCILRFFNQELGVIRETYPPCNKRFEDNSIKKGYKSSWYSAVEKV
jgi:hypothetical protein